MKVRDIMTSEELATATLDSTLEEIANMMRDQNVGAIPIVDDDDKLAGIVTDRDIVIRAIAEGEDPGQCTAEEILSEELRTVRPDADLEEAADLMARHQIRRLPVVEEERIVGIVSLGDISVKGDEEAGEALEDISEGVKRSGGGRAAQSSRGTAQRAASRESQFSSTGRRRSPGEQVAEEEAESQRSGAQQGSSRSEHATASRFRNQSRSQQSVADDLVNAEGEEEFEEQNLGGGPARQRANQQQPSIRGRQSTSARGRESGQMRGDSETRGERKQGASNRSQREERSRQQKVEPMRAESRASGRQRTGKRRAS